MFNPVKFLRPTRLFEMRPLSLSQTSLICLLILFIAIVITGCVFVWRKKKKKNDAFTNKFYTKAIALSFTSGIAGFVLLAFRQWRVHFFGARFWLLLWFVGFAVWSAFVIHYVKKIIPEKRNAKDAEELFGKYLPKKKKKKK